MATSKDATVRQERRTGWSDHVQALHLGDRDWLEWSSVREAEEPLSLDSIPRAVKRLISTTRSIDASIPLVESGQRRGEIRAGDPKALAIAFWGAPQGIAEVLVWYPNGSVPRPEHVVGLLRPDAAGFTSRRPVCFS